MTPARPAPSGAQAPARPGGTRRAPEPSPAVARPATARLARRHRWQPATRRAHRARLPVCLR
ncbi:hypothetical protein GCM10023324_65680 [Streptomyces youssoufiensis]